MSLKILTVDDSKSVRIIIKKVFKAYDTIILEAANGLEGLATANKEKPDLIILDVTMPVMDGIEMLTKLKSNNDLKQIPVLMLTAEAGRENVLKIAKIGIRDYIVKPFQADVIIEKAGRIIDLKPKEEKQKRQKRIGDEATVLVVDDKPAIIKQITNGLKIKNWSVHGIASQGEAIDFCQKQIPDIIIISLLLPESTAINLFRLLRSNNKTKYTPIFGLVVKTDKEQIASAKETGFTTVITKPIDFPDLENRIIKAMNLDTSELYYNFEEEFLIIKIPEGTTDAKILEINKYRNQKMGSAVDRGLNKIIFDIHEMDNFDTNIMKFLVESMNVCKELSISYNFVGNDKVNKEAKNYEESTNWVLHDSLSDAKSSFND